MNPKLSIIIPHKNSLELLIRCIKSIPQENYIEIIIIDDDSNPNKVDFLRLGSLQGKNVSIIFNKDAKGAGHARNLGLKEAKGEWLLFADADDFFVDGAFDIISSHFNDSADIVYFLSERRYSDTLESFDESCLGLNDKVKGYIGDEQSRDRLKYGICVPWGRIFRHSLIKNNAIVFDETRFANDTMFSIMSAYSAKTIIKDERVVYCFTANKGSLTHTLNKESILCRFQVDVRKNVFLKSIGKPQLQSSITHHLYHSIKYGIDFTIKLMFIAIKNGVNPFWGCFKWIIEHNRDKKKSDKITQWSK